MAGKSGQELMRYRPEVNFWLAVAAIALTAVLVAACTSKETAPAGQEPAGPAPAVAVVTDKGVESEPKPAVKFTGSGRLAEVTPFEDIAVSALGADAFVDNWFPGIALFDYDRDGDIDIYVSSAEDASPRGQARGGPNLLFRNEGDATFTEVAEEAGVTIPEANSTGVAACDLDNDGYQDLYVASYGRIGDDLDYRSVDDTPGLRDAVRDHIFRNNGDGTFEDVTEEAVEKPNILSALSIACADVNGDGWLDIYVGNRIDDDFLTLEESRHHGHYNVLYLNNRDFTFTDVTDEAGLLGGEIKLLDFDGQPVQYTDPVTGRTTVGFDPQFVDDKGNLVGDPTGQTLAVMFFDYDSDGDPDLWQADDGDLLKVYRNDSTEETVRFTRVDKELGIDMVGAWMGFALGDYDSDSDLDVFVTNIGFHPLLNEQLPIPTGDCASTHMYDWSTCYHFLLENKAEQAGAGAGLFENVAPKVEVTPSGVLPPPSLDPSNYLQEWGVTTVPPGLEAYDFGFGTTFLDMENDGDQDLYWLGSMGGRGEGPYGQQYEGVGRMMRSDGTGNFEDVTVESRLLDIAHVDYEDLDPTNPLFDPIDRRLSPEFHENGKGVAKGDLNGDGYVDLVGSNSMGPVWVGPNLLDLLGGRLFVWLNGGGENDWVGLRLKGRMAIDGTGSNADAIGARVVVWTKSADGVSSSQVQDVLGGSSFISMNSTDLHFGLGRENTIDRVEIAWPSGMTQVLEDLESNVLHEIVEPAP